MPPELTPEEAAKKFSTKTPIAALPKPAADRAVEGCGLEARASGGLPALAVENRPKGTDRTNGREGHYLAVSRDRLIPREDNPRRLDTKSEAFLALVASVRSAGIVTPLLGRPHPVMPDCVELLAGHRRRMAGMEADLAEFPVIVREMDDRTALEVLVFENLDRENLTPLEEARGVDLLLSSGHGAQEIADRMGKTRGWVARRANLLNLTKQWQEWAEEKGLSALHLELIARYPKARQDGLYERLVEGYDLEDFFMGPNSYKALEREIADEMRDLKLVPWNVDDTVLSPKAGACAACPKRSGCQPDLFADHEEAGDRCLDPDCWDEKMKVFKEKREAALRVEHPGLVKVVGKGGSDYSSENKGALRYYEYSKCAQKSAGAVPALVVDGEGEGTLTWVKAKAGSTAPRGEQKLKTAAAKQAAASQDPKACEALLKEKREGLEKRRMAWVIQKLLELLDESELPAAPEFATAEGMLALVVGFGTKNYYGEGADEVPEEWETKPGGIEQRRLGWEMVKPEIKQKMFFRVATDIGEHHEEGCKYVAHLLGVNLQALWDEAEKEIPEPKSWEQLKKLSEAPALHDGETWTPEAEVKTKKAAGKKKGGKAA